MYFQCTTLVVSLLVPFTDDRILGTDELLPVAGKDETYDEVMCEIEELEKTLDAQLTKFEKKLGLVYTSQEDSLR